MPDAAVYYAMKANPAPEILQLLAGLGSSFDAASVNEIDMVLATGAGPERISFGNTIKKRADIAAAYERGVRLYAFELLGGAGEDRRSGAGKPRLLPHQHVRHRRRVAAVAQVRLRAADGGRAAAARGGTRARALRHLVPRRLAAARSGAVGPGRRRGGDAVPRARRRRRHPRHAQHRRRLADPLPQPAAEPLRLRRGRSAGRSGATSATASRRSSSSRGGRWSATPASSRPRWC